VWHSADGLLIHRGPLVDDTDSLSKKSAAVYQWLFGYDIPETVLLLRKDGQFWFWGTQRKCGFLQPAAEAMEELAATGVTTKNGKSKPSPVKALHFLVRPKDGHDDDNIATLEKEAGLGGPATVAVLSKERAANLATDGLVGTWEKRLDALVAANGDSDQVPSLVDASTGLAFVMSVKDETELDLMKKSSVLANKVMKHGFVKRMEQAIDSEESITHDTLAQYVDEILEDPSKINLKVPSDDVQSCFLPIVQSGGTYDLKISAQNTANALSHDVILVSLGARYKLFCSFIARTFLVDPPKKVSELYELLLEMEEACLRVMTPGKSVKSVHQAAVAFLESRPGYEYLVQHLPKTLGFLTGIEIRESTFSISHKTEAVIRSGMVFCLSVGFQNVPLEPADLAHTPDNSAVRMKAERTWCVAYL
jgi:nucleosome binding factor SPN SPT16 subunit